MLYYAVVLLLMALVAAAFGFGGLATGGVGITRLLFFVFMLLALASAVLGLVR